MTEIRRWGRSLCRLCHRRGSGGKEEGPHHQRNVSASHGLCSLVRPATSRVLPGRCSSLLSLLPGLPSGRFVATYGAAQADPVTVLEVKHQVVPAQRAQHLSHAMRSWRRLRRTEGRLRVERRQRFGQHGGLPRVEGRKSESIYTKVLPRFWVRCSTEGKRFAGFSRPHRKISPSIAAN